MNRETESERYDPLMNRKSAGSSAGHRSLVKCQPPPGESNCDNNASVAVASSLRTSLHRNNRAFDDLEFLCVRLIMLNACNIPFFQVCPQGLLPQMKPS